MNKTDDTISTGRDVLLRESQAIHTLADNLGESFTHLVELIESQEARVILSGVGKSGLVAQKVAATLTSTGTPAQFLHPTEAVHGDLGIVREKDLLMVLSKSGSSSELLQLIPHVRRMGATVAAVVATYDSALSKEADVVISIGNIVEACDLDLVPTTSTTVMMALGDALAVALLKRRGLTAEDFAFVHPGGIIGRRMTRRVSDLMHTGNDFPVVPPQATLRSALVEIVDKGLGVTAISDGSKLLGILTDGDLKRILLSSNEGDSLEKPVEQFMSRNPATIAPTDLLATAVRLMESHRPNPITSLVALEDGSPIGILHLHDCLRMQ